MLPKLKYESLQRELNRMRCAMDRQIDIMQQIKNGLTGNQELCEREISRIKNRIDEINREIKTGLKNRY